MNSPAPRRVTAFLVSAAVAAVLAGTAAAQDSGTPAAPAAKNSAAKAAAPARSTSYSLGVSMGDQLHASGISPETINSAQLAQGLRDALTGKTTLTEADRTNLGKLFQSAAAAQAEVNHKAAAKFLAENGKKPDVVTTASGLQYRVLAPGSGPSPKPTDEVTVNYTGKLLNGTEFDSSYKRGAPAKFILNRVIPGWTEGVGLMKAGSKFELFIPPALAYEAGSPPDIPPGSLLIFTVELMSFKSPTAAPAAPATTPKQ